MFVAFLPSSYLAWKLSLKPQRWQERNGLVVGALYEASCEKNPEMEWNDMKLMKHEWFGDGLGWCYDSGCFSHGFSLFQGAACHARPPVTWSSMDFRIGDLKKLRVELPGLPWEKTTILTVKNKERPGVSVAYVSFREGIVYCMLVVFYWFLVDFCWFFSQYSFKLSGYAGQQRSFLLLSVPQLKMCWDRESCMMKAVRLMLFDWWRTWKSKSDGKYSKTSTMYELFDYSLLLSYTYNVYIRIYIYIYVPVMYASDCFHANSPRRFAQVRPAAGDV